MLKKKVISEKSCIFAPRTPNETVMSEKQKKVEKERRGVLELFLQKNGLTRKELVDFLLGVWMAGKIDELTEQEKLGRFQSRFSTTRRNSNYLRQNLFSRINLSICQENAQVSVLQYFA